MADLLSIVTGLGAGLLLGGFFFAGLWWTIRRGLSNPKVALWFVASYAIRVALLASGLYWLAHDNSVRGISGCVGVVVARIVVARFGATVSAGNVLGGDAT